MTADVIQIGMAQLAVSSAPGVIRSAGLGSCIAVVLYDPFARVGGMAHAMLPQSRPGRVKNRAKYIDTSLATLLERMLERGCTKSNIIAKIAGGAQMFPDSDRELLVVGAKNIEAARRCLQKAGIPLVAEDVGGNIGRTLNLDCSDGTLYIKTLHSSSTL